MEEAFVQRLIYFVKHLPVHFVSAKVFRNLDNASLKSRVLNNQSTPANALMMQRFRLFDLDSTKTGIPPLRHKLQDATAEYLSAHFLRRMESHVRREVDDVIEFFRRQRLGAELQLAGQATSYHEIRRHVEARVSEILASTEGSERHLGQIKSDFQKKASEILSRVQSGFERALIPKRTLWNLLPWNTLRAVGRRRGRHVTSSGIEIYVQGDLAEIYSEELRATWVKDRDRLIDAICGDHLNELVHRIQRVIDEGKGFALGKDDQTSTFVEQQMGDFAEKATVQLNSLREEFRKRTEDYESLRSQLIPEVGGILSPTFHEIGCESGPGCDARMRGYLQQGLDKSLDEIHQKVREKVAANWESFIQEAVDHTTLFVTFIRDWVAGLNQIPETTGNQPLELRKERAEELELLLRNSLDPDPPSPASIPPEPVVASV